MLLLQGRQEAALVSLSDVTTDTEVTNGIIFRMFLEIQEKKLPWKLIKDKLGTIYKDIDLEVISEAALRRSCDAVKQKRKKIMRNKNYQHDLESFFGQKFKLPECKQDPPLNSSANTIIQPPLKKPKFISFKEEVAKNINASLLDDVCTLQNCKRDLEEQIKHQAKQLQHVEQNSASKDKTVRPIKHFDGRRTNEKLQRKTQQAKKWRMLAKKKKEQDKSFQKLEDDVQKLKGEKKNLQLKLHYLRRRHERKEKSFEKEIEGERLLNMETSASLTDQIVEQEEEHHNEIVKLKQRITELEMDNSQLNLQLEDSNQHSEKTDIIQTKKKGAYNEKLRQCVYFCLSKEVPVSNINAVLQFVLNTFTDSKLCEVPSTRTICRMANEMNTLADIQTYEKIESASNITLCFDGTTKNEHHLNELHLNTEEGAVMVGLGDLPGGTATDYRGHISQGFQDLAETASLFTKKPQEEILDSLTSSVSGVVTDRCVVNHAVVTQLEEIWKHHIIEMKCNVHPLDGVAASANKTLKQYEQDKCYKGKLFGNNSSAVNVIAAVSKLRFKNGKGDPRGLKDFLKRKSVSLGTSLKF